MVCHTRMTVDATPWSTLPHDLLLKIVSLRGAMLRSETAAVCVQRHWQGYRVRALMSRFRLLRYLKIFRKYNPCARIFMTRARL